MSVFTTKQILSSQTIGERLKKTREGHGFSLAYVSTNTRIRLAYLEAIESGQYAELPGGVYGEEYIKTYARFLHLPASQVVQAFKSERSEYATYKHKPETVFRSARATLYHLQSQTVVRLLTIALIVFGVGYGFVLLRTFLSSPTITILSPEIYTYTADNQVAILGTTHKTLELYLNGEALALDTNGGFNVDLTLPPGLSTLVFTAKGSLDKEETQYVYIQVEAPETRGVVLR